MKAGVAFAFTLAILGSAVTTSQVPISNVNTCTTNCCPVVCTGSECSSVSLGSTTVNTRPVCPSGQTPLNARGLCTTAGTTIDLQCVTIPSIDNQADFSNFVARFQDRDAILYFFATNGISGGVSNTCQAGVCNSAGAAINQDKRKHLITLPCLACGTTPVAPVVVPVPFVPAPVPVPIAIPTTVPVNVPVNTPVVVPVSVPVPAAVPAVAPSLVPNVVPGVVPAVTTARQVPISTVQYFVPFVCEPNSTPKKCAKDAVCAGYYNKGDDCTSIDASLTKCPGCKGSSKKGLLGLLGLLGLIPLLLCCCLLCGLLCCRRKKADPEVHFATFDAGAVGLHHPGPVEVCSPGYVYDPTAVSCAGTFSQVPTQCGVASPVFAH